METRAGRITLRPLNELLARNTEIKREVDNTTALPGARNQNNARIAQQQRNSSMANASVPKDPQTEQYGRHAHNIRNIKEEKSASLTISDTVHDHDDIIIVDDDKDDLDVKTKKNHSNHIATKNTVMASGMHNATSNNSDKENSEYCKLSNSQKRRLAAKVRCIYKTEMIKKLSNIRFERLRGVLKDKDHFISKSDQKQQDLKNGRFIELSSNKMNYNYDLAIVHGCDPVVCLTLQEIQFIKSRLLFEIDTSDCTHLNHQFVENYIRDGWWSITCQNYQTKEWVMSTVPRLHLWPNANVKVVNISNKCRCVTFLPHDDILPKNILLSRLQKQNCNLKTGKWRIAKVEQNNGGETIWFTVDEQSKEVILQQKQKLWLNFSQIYVSIEPGKEENMNRNSPLTCNKMVF